MELKDMTIEQLEERKSAIVSESEATEEREALDNLEAEIKSINAELEARKAIEAEKNEVKEQIDQLKI